MSIACRLLDRHVKSNAAAGSLINLLNLPRGMCLRIIARNAK